jgi:hypothetical protein
MTLVCQLSFPSQGHRCLVGWTHPSYKKQIFYAGKNDTGRSRHQGRQKKAKEDKE